MTSQEYAVFCRTARQAYFAWQAAPAGQGDEALDAYLKADAALKKAQKLPEPKQLTILGS